LRFDETGTGYLHRLHRRIVRSRFGRSGAGGMKRLVKGSLAPFYWHVQPIVQSVAEVRSRGGFVRSTYGIGTLEQLKGCLAITAAFRAGPGGYYDYRLFLGDRWAQREAFIYDDEMWVLLAWINSKLGPEEVRDLRDKRRFAARAAKAGLPVIPILAAFDRGATVHACSSGELPRSDLFSKNADLGGGQGARAWEWRPDGSYRAEDGSHLGVAELYQSLRTQSLQYPVILQPRITNHRALLPIAGNGLSTLRIVTVRDLLGRISVPPLACLRMAAGRLVADNYSGGGLIAGVSLEEGRLGSAVSKSRPDGLDVHPDSGASIRGFGVPQWAEAKRLAIAAHEEFKSLPSIGWDIAITAAGPVLVEGNSEWASAVQIPLDRPLGATSVPDLLAEHVMRLVEARGGLEAEWLR